MHVRHSPLLNQYADPDSILADIKKILLKGDFTEDSAVAEFEKIFSEKVDRKNSISVGSGTDALKDHLESNCIEGLVYHGTLLHLHPAATRFAYSRGGFQLQNLKQIVF